MKLKNKLITHYAQSFCHAKFEIYYSTACATMITLSHDGKYSYVHASMIGTYKYKWLYILADKHLKQNLILVS